MSNSVLSLGYLEGGQVQGKVLLSSLEEQDQNQLERNLNDGSWHGRLRLNTFALHPRGYRIDMKVGQKKKEGGQGTAKSLPHALLCSFTMECFVDHSVSH